MEPELLVTLPPLLSDGSTQRLEEALRDGW
jgi:hypothetical protein